MPASPTAPGAIIVEEVLNYLWRQHKYQDEIRLAVDDWIVAGHGWVKAGYKAVKPPEEKASGEPGCREHENLSTDAAIHRHR